jgi:uncharacterized membrane protein YgcG
MLAPIFLPFVVLNSTTVQTNLNLNTLYSASYDISGPQIVLVNITANVSSTSTSTPALRVGTGWPAGVIMILNIASGVDVTGHTGSTGSTGSGGGGGSGGSYGQGGAGGSGASQD